jgi:hypothetical protein
MPFCMRLSEQLAVVATIDPQTGATGAVTSDSVAMALHRRALFILQSGAGMTAGIAVAIQEGTVGWTAGTATILSAAATAIVAPNSQWLYEVSGEAMADGLTHLRAIVTPVNVGLFSLICLADVERYYPASDRDLASVVAIQAAN